MPLMSAMSERGFSGRKRSAIIAVLVTRGSATISVLSGLASSHWQRIGWLSAMFAPIRRMTSAICQILVRSGRTIAAERALVPGDRAGHAQRSVSVEVLAAEPKLRKFAERVELFRDQLPGAQDADRIGPILLLHTSKFLRHHRQRLVPIHADERAVLSQQRIAGPVLRFERVVFGKPFGAKRSEVGAVIGVSAHAHRAAIFHAQKHSAAHRAIPARRRYPAVGNFLRGRISRDCVGGVRVLFAEDVQAERAFQVHHAAFPW